MAEKLEVEVAATGVEETVAAIGRVAQAEEQLAATTARTFAQSVAQIREEVEHQDLRAAAEQRVAAEQQEASRKIEAAKRRQGVAFESAMNAARMQSQGLRDNARATQATAAATQAAVNTAINFTTKLQGAASAVTGLASAMGNPNGTTGLVANVAGTTAQFAMLGNMLGPGGALITGVLGFSYGIAQLVEATRTAEGAQRGYRQEIDRSIGAIDDYIEAAGRMATAQRRMQLIQEGLGSADEQAAAANLQGQEVGRLRMERSPLLQRLSALQRAGDSGSAREQSQRRSEIAALEAQIAPIEARIDDALVEFRRLADLAAQAEAGAAADSADDASLAADGDLASGGGGSDPASRAAARRARRILGTGGGRGGNRERAADGEERLRQQRLAAEDMLEDALRAPDLERKAREHEAAGGDAKGDAAMRALEMEREALREANDLKREQEQIQADLAETARVAQLQFAEGWTDSVDQVVEAFKAANEALKDSGQGMISHGRLLERSLVAVGNNIAETIGGTMQGAFTDALGAWLDGSKSFVQAAEDMAKGVIKALTIESIVQAVTEVARAVASFASQDHASGVAHLAAAAAWGAVGVVAGGVGAAVGAFGGGGADKSASQGADNRDLSSRSVSERETQIVNVINLYPQWATQREVDTFVIGAVNSGIRDGRQIDPRGFRGAGGR